MADTGSACSSEISADSANGANIQMTSDELFHLLLHDLSALSDYVEEAHQQAENTRAESLETIVLKNLKSSYGTEQHLSHVKEGFMDALSKTLEFAEPIGEANFPAYVESQLQDHLVEIINTDKQLIDHMKAELIEIRNNIEECEKKSQEIKDSISKRAEKGEMVTTTNWAAVEAQIKSKRLSLVKDLRIVEKELGINSNILSIMHSTMKAAQSGDPYIPVEDGSHDDIEFLLLCNLVTRHPHDSMKIRLVNVL